ncbi:MAG: NUDIX hydrolase [Erysipelotrichaceae bacterium]
MEVWFLYDENRQLVDTNHLRGDIIEDGLFHISVGAWLFDGHHFLITQRASGKSFEGTWENTGGNAIKEETSLMAILREVQEEVGLKVENPLLISSDIDEVNQCIFDTYFIYVKNGFKDVEIDHREVAGFQCLAYNELEELMLSDCVCEIIKARFKQNKGLIKEISNGYTSV